jgi:hypothetical protein
MVPPVACCAPKMVQQATAAGAHQPGDADHLAPVHRQRHRSQPFGGQVADPQARLGGAVDRRQRRVFGQLPAHHVPHDQFLGGLRGRQVGDHLAVAQHHQPGTQREHLVEPVPDEHHGTTRCRVPAGQVEHGLRLDRTQRGGGFVQDEQPR